MICFEFGPRGASTGRSIAPRHPQQSKACWTETNIKFKQNKFSFFFHYFARLREIHERLEKKIFSERRRDARSFGFRFHVLKIKCLHLSFSLGKDVLNTIFYCMFKWLTTRRNYSRRYSVFNLEGENSNWDGYSHVNTINCSIIDCSYSFNHY